ncbi:MAG: hypothetical protein CMJ36_03510 [Phycisphaerae bacterium]|nr:hypothetical protein [Phycisphaerae bacterium]
MPDGTRLLTRCFRAMGGPGELEQVHSMHVNAVVKAGDESLGEIEMFLAKGDRCLFRFTQADGDTNSFGSNGTVSWEQVPPSEGGGWKLLPKEQLARRIAGNNWLGRVLHLGAETTSMKTTGKVEFDDRPCWAVDLEFRNDEPMTAFFDAETKLITGFQRRFDMPQEEDVESFVLEIVFDEWKPVGKVTLFHEVRLQIKPDISSLRLNYETLTINDVPDSTFDLPSQVKALVPGLPSSPSKESPDGG